MENYAGAGEIALFGQDWLTFHNSFLVGTSLFIRAKIVQSKYGDRQDLQIKTVELLSDVKDTLIEKVRIDISLGDLTPTVVEELSDIVMNNPGNTDVYFHINTPDRLNDVLLKPISLKMTLGKEFINFFNMHDYWCDGGRTMVRLPSRFSSIFTLTVSSGNSSSIYSGHSIRQRHPL